MGTRILEALFGPTRAWEPSWDGGAISLTTFQEAAAHRVRKVLARRGGALLADAVGLGKTYVALALAEERIRAGEELLVVIPATLRPLWREPLRRIGREDRWRLVSHTQLSRGFPVPPATGSRLVVVDEAHRFRNPTTRRYGALARLAARPSVPGVGRDLLLITATPVNNALDDLYHLVRLFLPDDGLRDAGVPSLRSVFDARAPDPAGLQAVVRELVVRRSRRTVDERFGSAGVWGGAVASRHQPVRFPARAPPVVHRYRDPSLPARVDTIEGLELEAYGDGGAPLVRLGLLKRLDSSPEAFRASVRGLRTYLHAFIEAAAAGRLMRPGDRLAAGDADPLQLLLVGVVAGPAPASLDLDALITSAERDLRALDRAVPPGTRHGSGMPKSGTLLELVRQLLPDRVLVFTECRDTAEALWRSLGHELRVGRIDGSGAWLGRAPAGRRRVVERFAPVANGRTEPPDRERVDVLVATDVLAEGLNLQDARHVVSYDLPWNPVRLLQRIGRVDRLGSAHATVVPHLFVPADGLDRVLGLTRRLRSKLHGIVSALEEEPADELLESLVSGPAGRVHTALRKAEEEAVRDPLEALRTLWLEIGRNRRDAAALPPTAGASAATARQPRPWAEVRVPVDSPAAGLEAVAVLGTLSEVEGGGRFVELAGDGIVAGPTRAGVAAVESALRAGSAAPGEAPESPEVASRLQAGVARVADYCRTANALDRAPTRLDPGAPAARLARRVRRALARCGSALDPDTLQRAGDVLAGLRRPVHPALEEEITQLLDQWGTAGSGEVDTGALIAAAASILGPTRKGSGPLGSTGSTVLRALLLVSPREMRSETRVARVDDV